VEAAEDAARARAALWLLEGMRVEVRLEVRARRPTATGVLRTVEPLQRATLISGSARRVTVTGDVAPVVLPGSDVAPAVPAAPAVEAEPDIPAGEPALRPALGAATLPARPRQEEGGSDDRTHRLFEEMEGMEALEEAPESSPALAPMVVESGRWEPAVGELPAAVLEEDPGAADAPSSGSTRSRRSAAGRYDTLEAELAFIQQGADAEPARGPGTDPRRRAEVPSLGVEERSASRLRESQISGGHAGLRSSGPSAAVRRGPPSPWPLWVALVLVVCAGAWVWWLLPDLDQRMKEQWRRAPQHVERLREGGRFTCAPTEDGAQLCMLDAARLDELFPGLGYPERLEAAEQCVLQVQQAPGRVREQLRCAVPIGEQGHPLQLRYHRLEECAHNPTELAVRAVTRCTEHRETSWQHPLWPQPQVRTVSDAWTLEAVQHRRSWESAVGFIEALEFIARPEQGPAEIWFYGPALQGWARRARVGHPPWEEVVGVRDLTGTRGTLMLAP
jgi:hypothetical protein